MKSLKFIIFLLLFCCGLGAWADNSITLSSVEGAAGTEVTVSVSMTNTDAVSALQLSIPLDDNLTFVQNSQQAGSRLSGHSLSAGVKDGVLNLMLYSTTMSAISGNEGVVCSFKLRLGTNPGTIYLTPSKTALTSTEGQALDVSVSAGSVKILGAKTQLGNTTINFGRVAINSSSRQTVMVTNVGNETLTISEISFTSSEFSTTATLPLTINAGSTQWIYVNCAPTSVDVLDEEMTITSNSTSGNCTVRLTATPYGVNELRLGNVTGSTDEEVTVPVSMNNYNDITGLQMEIQIPNGLEYVGGSFELSGRKDDHVVLAYVSDDFLSAVVYSPTDKPFTGSAGEIGSFKVKIVGSNNCNLTFKKATMSSTVSNKTIDVISASYGCKVSVKSPSLSADNRLDFGRIPINEQEKQRSYAISNHGSAPLVISNINFANGLFRVKEQLPITIESSSITAITVVCEAMDEGDISTNMEIYTNDPNKRLYIAKITGEIFTPDYLTPIVGAKSDEVNLSVYLNNYSDIYGIQFDIDTDKEFTASVNDVTLTGRGNNLSVSINSIAEGKLRVVAYANNNQFISSGEGNVMTIKLIPKESLVDDTYSMTLSNITLGSKGMKNIYAGSDVSITYGLGDPVVVKARSYTREYGVANPTFEYDLEGAELEGQPQIVCGATKSSPVGTYNIVISKGSVSNVNGTYMNGSLTITKAPLTISVGNYTMKQGGAMPDFTLNYDGFRNYESKSVLIRDATISCQATKTSEPGQYPIIVSGADAENYQISYISGILTVTSLIMGDVNGDGKVTITDAVGIVNYLLNNPAANFNELAADMNGDGSITITDAVGVVNKILQDGSSVRELMPLFNSEMIPE